MDQRGESERGGEMGEEHHTFDGAALSPGWDNALRPPAPRDRGPPSSDGFVPSVAQARYHHH